MSTGWTKMRWVVPVCMVLAVSSGAYACGGDDDDAGGDGGGEETITFGAALFGPKNDQSFNQAAYEGMLAAEKEDPRLELTALLENRNTQQNEIDSVETLAPNNDLMVGVSETYGPVFDVMAPKFPDKYFIDIAGYTETFQENVTGFANDWGAPAYVMGVVAANLTETDTVGFVGGAEISPTVHAQNGFEAGVESVDSNITVLKNIVGDFNDVAKGKAATAAMISDGADVIFPFLDAGIAGAYAAGEESGENPAMFKIVVPDCKGYDNIVGTEIVDNAAATKRMILDYAKGTLEPGAVFLDLQEPEIQTFALCPDYEQDEEIARVVQETIDGVNSGDIKLPEDAIFPRPDYPYKEGFEGETIDPSGAE